MKHRATKLAYLGLTVLAGGVLVVLPGCSDSSSGPGDGGGLRDARAIVYGTVEGNGQPAADVEVTVTPRNSACERELLGGAAPTVTTDAEGGYRVVIEREIVGSTVTICPEVEFVVPSGSGLSNETIVGRDDLVELRDVSTGADSVRIDADLTPS